MIKAIAIYLAIHLIMDLTYLSVAGGAYQSKIRKLLVDKSEPPLKLYYMMGAYVPFLIATFYLVFLPAYQHKISLERALVNGLMYASAIYGVYNFTNMVMINNYPFVNAMIDILYGIVSIGLLVIIAWHLG